VITRGASPAVDPWRRFSIRPAREAIAVIGGVAERHLAGPRALDEEADVVLVRHADAAVHLHGLAGDQAVGIRQPGLGSDTSCAASAASASSARAAAITAERDSSSSM